MSGRVARATIRALGTAWTGFFYHPEPVEGIACFRVLWGACLLLNWAQLAPDVLVWLGDAGVLSRPTAVALTGPGRLDVFRLLPPGVAWVWLVFGVTVLASVSLTVGFGTRTSAALVFVGLASIHHRNPLVLNSGDTLLRVVTFLLIFAPDGEALSVDRWLARRHGDAPPAPPCRAPWVQRLIQIQVAVLYLSTVAWKLEGSMWRDGTAVYYMSRLVEFQRFPALGVFDRLWAIHALTWGSLAVEASLGTLVWLPPFRYPVLLAGALFHLGVEYTLNVPLFQWLMLACLTTFVPPTDVTRAIAWLRGRFWPASPSRELSRRRPV